MDARGKFGEHERSVRVARGVAESNSSFLSSTSTSRLALRNSLNALTILILPQTLLQPVIAVTNLCIIDL